MLHRPAEQLEFRIGQVWDVFAPEWSTTEFLRRIAENVMELKRESDFNNNAMCPWDTLFAYFPRLLSSLTGMPTDRFIKSEIHD